MRIEDYGFIGDTHTGALVGSNGSMDWLCLPRFDSAACFAALLGEEKNGCWQMAPSDQVIRGHQRYRGETLILETTFETETGTVAVIDCMPQRTERRHVIRLVEGRSGEVAMRMRLLIRLDYGRVIPWVQHVSEGINAVAGPDALLLRSEVPTRGEGMSTVAEFVVREGESRAFVLTWYPSHEAVPDPIDARRLLKHTELFWREWAARCAYSGEHRSQVIRSLLTLKGLTYAPSGGILAAATTSLPEHLGGVRNWDYRFCWLRDATFTLLALMEAGYTEEASAWIGWLLRAVAGDPSQLQIMYGAAGERMLKELQLSHLSGYEGSRPVRIGNAASEQFQLDVYGEVMDAMHLAREMGIPLGVAAWRLQRHLVDFVEKHWTEPDEGIWEIRGPRRHFTHSKVMAWVAIDRAVKAVEQFDLEGKLEAWRSLRRTMFEEICARGYNAKRGAFTQYYGSDTLDGSLLMLPLVGFLPATDPRIVSTVEAIQRDLTEDSLVYRYHPDESGEIDGLPPGEGVFLPCTFWLIDCLQLMGRREEAAALLERVLSLQTPLGLFSEEYAPGAGRLVGNFPQAFTHVGLVNTVHNIAEVRQGPAEVRARRSGAIGRLVVPHATPA